MKNPHLSSQFSAFYRLLVNVGEQMQMDYLSLNIILCTLKRQHAKCPIAYASIAHAISAHLIPFPYFYRCALLLRFFFIHTRGVMEIPGLVPSNPRRNTSQNNFEFLRCGDKADACFHFVSALYPLSPEIPGKVDTEWRQAGYMYPLSYYLSSINS
jgi:hypothetical protein